MAVLPTRSFSEECGLLTVEVPSDDEDPTFTNSDVEVEASMGRKIDDPVLYATLADQTRSVDQWRKLAYPDLYGHCIPPVGEPFYEKKFGTQRYVHTGLVCLFV